MYFAVIKLDNLVTKAKLTRPEHILQSIKTAEICSCDAHHSITLTFIV